LRRLRKCHGEQRELMALLGWVLVVVVVVRILSPEKGTALVSCPSDRERILAVGGDDSSVHRLDRFLGIFAPPKSDKRDESSVFSADASRCQHAATDNETKRCKQRVQRFRVGGSVQAGDVQIVGKRWRRRRHVHRRRIRRPPRYHDGCRRRRYVEEGKRRRCGGGLGCRQKPNFQRRWVWDVHRCDGGMGGRRRQ
jgi:hypothetical protein